MGPGGRLAVDLDEAGDGGDRKNSDDDRERCCGVNLRHPVVTGMSIVHDQFHADEGEDEREPVDR
jgi:hypothetical protein